MRWLLLLCQFIPALANCATGKYLDQSVCKDCAKGRYQDETGQNDCTQCPSGWTTDGQDAQTSCNPCALGLYMGDNWARENGCRDCTPGFYTDDTGNIWCKRCSYGQYNDESVAHSCKDCLMGKYNDEAAGIVKECKDCAFGKYLDEEGKSASTDCKFCGAGTEFAEYAYEVKTSGTCDTPVTTQEECEAAYNYFGSIGSFYTGAYASDVPPNCWKTDGSWGTAWNTATSVAECGGSGRDCICRIPVYEVKTSNTCDNYITTAEECEAAAVALGVSDEPASLFDTEYVPPGCFQDSGSLVLHFNTGSGTSSESSTSNRICKRDSFKTCESCGNGKYQDQNDQSVCKDCAFGKYQSEEGQTDCKLCGVGTEFAEYAYELKTSGTCDTYITTAEECEAAAALLVSTTDSSQLAATPGWPTGCVFRDGMSKPYFNGVYSNDCGSDNYDCICKVPVYFLQDSGFCDNPITTQEECTKAGLQLGLQDSNGASLLPVSDGLAKYCNTQNAAGINTWFNSAASTTECGANAQYGGDVQCICKTLRKTLKTCESCPSGKGSVAGQPCSACPVGKGNAGIYYADVGMGQFCQNCFAGKYQDEEGKGSCKLCAPGKSTGTGSTSCEDCPAGKTMDLFGTCASCSAGTYMDDVGTAWKKYDLLRDLTYNQETDTTGVPLMGSRSFTGTVGFVVATKLDCKRKCFEYSYVDSMDYSISAPDGGNNCLCHKSEGRVPYASLQVDARCGSYTRPTGEQSGGYATFLDSSHPLASTDRAQECANRCSADGWWAFYLHKGWSGRCMCALNDCSNRVVWDQTDSYVIYNRRDQGFLQYDISTNYPAIKGNTGTGCPAQFYEYGVSTRSDKHAEGRYEYWFGDYDQDPRRLELKNGFSYEEQSGSCTNIRTKTTDGAYGDYNSNAQDWYFDNSGWRHSDGNSGATQNNIPLCQGDCDADYQCADGLVCFQRDALEPIPGCDGAGTSGGDYCVRGIWKPYLSDLNFDLVTCKQVCDSDEDCQGFQWGETVTSVVNCQISTDMCDATTSSSDWQGYKYVFDDYDLKCWKYNPLDSWSGANSWSTYNSDSVDYSYQCKDCPYGRFQDNIAATSCENCPSGTEYRTTGYELKFSGECDNVITTAEECEIAAEALLKIKVTHLPTATSNRPPGCYTSGTIIAFNSDASTTACSSEYGCICKEPLYFTKSSGTCDNYITTTDECEAARDALDLNDQDITPIQYSGRSKGCITADTDTVEMNFYVFSTEDCGADSYDCICKRASSTTSCSECSVGKYQDHNIVTAVACKDCKFGKYQNEVGQPGCKFCGAGTEFAEYAYEVKTSGTCDNYVTTAEECEAASDGFVDARDLGNSYPAGCVTTSTVSYFNLGVGGACGDSNYDCICRIPLYFTKSSGTCDKYISTLEECEAAAVALGISDITAASNSWTNYAPGCFLDGSLYFNTNTASTSDCVPTGNFCICKRASFKTCESCVNGKYRDSSISYYVENTGTCQSAGYMSITEKPECEAATTALGFTGYYYQEYNDGTRPFCFTYDSMPTNVHTNSNPNVALQGFDTGGIVCQKYDLECKECPNGYASYGTSGLSCSTCPVGRFSLTLSDKEEYCTLCTSGKYQDEEIKSECKDCSYGKYQDEEGQSGCKFCGAGAEFAEYAYELKTSGTCDNYVTTAEECEAAAVGMGLPDTTAGVASWTGYAPGCVFDRVNGDNLYFNTNTGSPGECKNSGECICKIPLYFTKDSGSCANPITTAEECEAASEYLGLLQYQSAASVTYNPPGCMESSDGTYFNSNMDSTTECGTNSRPCICKREGYRLCESCPSGQYQDKNDVAGVTCKDCASGKYQDEEGKSSCKFCAAGKRFVGDYEVKTSGTCDNYITTAEECEAAATELGFSWHTGTHSSWETLYPQGCMRNSVNQLYLNTYTNSIGCGYNSHDCICKNSHACESCPAGQYQDENDVAGVTCKACVKGRYQNEEGKTDCKLCPDGWTTDGQDSQASCTACGLGEFMGNDERREDGCAACAIGFYSDETGNMWCKNCNVGKFAPSTGLSECQDCVYGKYQDENTGAISQCKFCGAGTEFAEYAPWYQGSGSCGSSITTAEECEASAVALGFTYTTEDSWSSYPHGCLLNSQDEVMFNTNTNTHACGHDYHDCICKFPVYLTVDSGTCNIPITTMDECRAARDALDLNDQDINPVSYSGYSHGCVMADTDTVVFNSYTASTEDCGYEDWDCICKRSSVEQCESCAAGQYQAQTQVAGVTCSDCASGQYQNEEAQAQCKGCASGYYQDEEGDLGCKICPSGWYRHTSHVDDGENCHACPSGQYQDEEGTQWHADCKECSAGTYTDQSGQAQCDPYITCGNQLDGSSRLVGNSSTTSGTCAACTTGADHNGNCLCAPGKGSDGTVCVDCVSLTFNSVWSDSGEICAQVACPTGEGVKANFNVSSSQNCEVCGGGKFSDDAGVGQCENIAAGNRGIKNGTYVATGATSEEVCPSGTYNTDGSGDCAAIAVGYRGLKNGAYVSSGATAQGACPIGTYNTDGSGDCILCPSGKYQDEEGTPQCIDVSAGYRAMKDGVYVSSGATAQGACPSDTYNTDGSGDCTAVDAGHRAVTEGQYVSSGAAGQEACPSGTYNTDGSGDCSDVQDGYRAIKDGAYVSTGATSEEPCPSDTYNADGSGDCTAVDVDHRAIKDGAYVSTGATGQEACPSDFVNSDGVGDCGITEQGLRNLVAAWSGESLNHLDVSKVTDMSFLFKDTNFDGDISNWDTAKVTTMKGMFQRDLTFNQDISSWDVSSVTDFSYMFNMASNNSGTAARMLMAGGLFNQPIGSWDMTSAVTVAFMFAFSTFNQNISTWNTAQVTTMESMFVGSSFDQDINAWNVTNVQNMDNMFKDAVFDQLVTWDLTNKSISDLFSGSGGQLGYESPDGTVLPKGGSGASCPNDNGCLSGVCRTRCCSSNLGCVTCESDGLCAAPYSPTSWPEIAVGAFLFQIGILVLFVLYSKVVTQSESLRRYFFGRKNRYKPVEPINTDP